MSPIVGDHRAAAIVVATTDLSRDSAMPRCLMAKKWKAYPWPERPDPPEDEDEEIDVVGDSPSSCWAPSSPTAGATAPSPPPTSPHGTTLLYNGTIS